MARGDFSAAVLGTVKKVITEMWEDPRNNVDPLTSVSTIKGLAENQKISAKPLSDAGTCQDVDVVFLRNCGPEVSDCSVGSDCNISGPELEADHKQYGPNFCKSTTFTVYDDQCNSAIGYAEKYAQALRDAQLSLKNALNTATIAFLEANAADVNDLTLTPPVGTKMPSGAINIEATKWTPDMIAQLALLAQMAAFRNPIFFNGTNLWVEKFNALYNFQNADGKDQLAKMNHFPNWFFDPMGFSVNSALATTYLVDGNNFAFFNKNSYAHEAPKLHRNGNVDYRLADLDLTWKNDGVSVPVYFDIENQEVCKPTAYGNRYGTVTRVTLRGGLIAGPAACDSDDTGIIKIVKGNET